MFSYRKKRMLAQFLRTAQETTNREGISINLENLEREIQRRKLNPRKLCFRVVKKRMLETMMFLSANGNVDCIIEKDRKVNLEKGFFEMSLLPKDSRTWIMFHHNDEIIFAVS